MAALIWCIFRKRKPDRLSSAGTKILAFGSHSMSNFQSILDCLIPSFKLKHEDLENIKTDCVSTVVFNLHQIKRRAFFMGHPVPVGVSGHYTQDMKNILNEMCQQLLLAI